MTDRHPNPEKQRFTCKVALFSEKTHEVISEMTRLSLGLNGSMFLKDSI
jgi:hypothetical protein